MAIAAQRNHALKLITSIVFPEPVATMEFARYQVMQCQKSLSLAQLTAAPVHSHRLINPAERQCGNLKDAIHLTGADVMGPNVDNSSPRINTSLLHKPPHTNPRLPVADVLSFNVIDPGIK